MVEGEERDEISTKRIAKVYCALNFFRNNHYDWTSGLWKLLLREQIFLSSAVKCEDSFLSMWKSRWENSDMLGISFGGQGVCFIATYLFLCTN